MRVYCVEEDPKIVLTTSTERLDITCQLLRKELWATYEPYCHIDSELWTGGKHASMWSPTTTWERTRHEVLSSLCSVRVYNNVDEHLTCVVSQWHLTHFSLRLYKLPHLRQVEDALKHWKTNLYAKMYVLYSRLAFSSSFTDSFYSISGESGQLFFECHRILSSVRSQNKGNHVFWLYENVCSNLPVCTMTLCTVQCDENGVFDFCIRFLSIFSYNFIYFFLFL